MQNPYSLTHQMFREEPAFKVGSYYQDGSGVYLHGAKYTNPDGPEPPTSTPMNSTAIMANLGGSLQVIGQGGYFVPEAPSS